MNHWEHFLNPKQSRGGLSVQLRNLWLCEKSAKEIFKDLSIKTSEALANLKKIRYRVILQTSKACKNCFSGFHLRNLVVYYTNTRTNRHFKEVGCLKLNNCFHFKEMPLCVLERAVEGAAVQRVVKRYKLTKMFLGKLNLRLWAI